MDRSLLELSKALADTTRLGIFEFLKESGRPLSVKEVAGHFDIHGNAARTHLQKLESAGLLIPVKDNSGPGRPSVRYRFNPQASGPTLMKRDHRFLSGILISFIEKAGFPPKELYDYGVERGKAIAGSSDLAHSGEVLTAEHLLGILSMLGFDPNLADSSEGTARIELRNCLFGDVVSISPKYLCALIDGIAAGAMSCFPHTELVSMDRGIPQGRDCCLMTVRLGR